MAASHKSIILLSFFVCVMAFFLQAGCSTAARPQPPANLPRKVAVKHAPLPTTHPKAAHKRAPSPSTHPKVAHKQAPLPATHLKAAHKQAPSPDTADERHHQLRRNKVRDYTDVTGSTAKPPSPAEKLTAPPSRPPLPADIPVPTDFEAYDLYMNTHCYIAPHFKCGTVPPEIYE